MTTWQTDKYGWGKWLTISLIAALTVSQLTHCGPKNKANSTPSEAAKAAGATPTVPEERSAGAMPDVLKIDEMKFSSLETTTDRLSAKAVLKSLKEKTEVSHDALARALIELNLVDAGRGASADDQMKIISGIAKSAETIGAKKIEELKAVYTLLEKANRTKMRHVNTAFTVDRAIEKNELNNYSATTLLSLLWLNSMTTDASKGLVLIEEGEMKLAELKGDHVMAINVETVSLVAQDLGTLKDYDRNAKRKVVSLPLFVIHEVLKKYVLDPKAWAVKIQKASNKVLGLTDDESKMLLAPVRAGKVPMNLSLSELNIGSGKDVAEGELSVEKPVETASTSPFAFFAFKEMQSFAPAMMINSDCYNRGDLQTRLNENGKKALPVSGLTVTQLSHFLENESSVGRGIIVVKLAQLKKMGLMDQISTLDSNLASAMAQAQVNGGRGYIDTALKLSFEQTKLVAAEILTYKKIIYQGAEQGVESLDANPVLVSSDVIELLKKSASVLMGDDVGSLMSADAVGTCSLSGS